MTTLPQPPNAPDPQMDESGPSLFGVTIVSEAQLKYIWVTGVVMIVVILGGFLPMPITPTRGCRSDQTEAVSNARQIGMALFEFQQEYGSLPDGGTIAKVRQKTGVDLKPDPKFSNCFFRQLFASGIANGEMMFYAHCVGARRPDNLLAGTGALEKTECGFTYFLGAITTSNPLRPLVVTPMIPGTDRFDPNPFGGKAVMLRADNTVMSYKIDKHGHVLIDDRNLMDPHHPIWDGQAPVIAWPDL